MQKELTLALWCLIPVERTAKSRVSRYFFGNISETCFVFCSENTHQFAWLFCKACLGEAPEHQERRGLYRRTAWEFRREQSRNEALAHWLETAWPCFLGCCGINSRISPRPSHRAFSPPSVEDADGCLQKVAASLAELPRQLDLRLCASAF